MQQKIEIIGRNIYKWKVFLNGHDDQQKKGVNYTDTYSPIFR